jgi:hypothetical protein
METTVVQARLVLDANVLGYLQRFSLNFPLIPHYTATSP